MARTNLTADFLRASLHYDPDSGIFTRLRRAGSANIGDIAGSLHKKSGYVHINLLDASHYAHRLAWLYTYGCWPKMHIDHIDRVKSNNRIENLRDVSRSHNLQNLGAARSDSATGVLGVTRDARCGSYRSNIFVDGRQVSLGYFQDCESASLAYVNAKRMLHAGCNI